MHSETKVADVPVGATHNSKQSLQYDSTCSWKIQLFSLNFVAFRDMGCPDIRLRYFTEYKDLTMFKCVVLVPVIHWKRTTV